MATLLPTALTLRERTLVGWVGLRGAAPIVLATFPLVARVPNAQFIFDLIFFVVVTSALIQGTTVSWVARRLRLSAPAGTGGTVDPLDLVAAGDRDIVEFRVNAGSEAVGRRLLDLGLAPWRAGCFDPARRSLVCPEWAGALCKRAIGC